MKKSVEILGLPVFSISEGCELGTAKALVIDPIQGAVSAIAIEDGKWYLGAKLLPFNAVAGIGENAITVESSNQILSLPDAPELGKLLAADIKTIGAKVLTKVGRYKGQIIEIGIDDSGKIVSYEIEDPNGAKTEISGVSVITFGKEVVIINDTENAGSAFPAPKSVSQTVISPQTAVNVEPVPAATVSAKPAQQETYVVAEPSAKDDSAKKFEEKQRKYLLGKKANRRIETENGLVIIDAGGEITEEVIQKAKLAGKFVELSMSI